MHIAILGGTGFIGSALRQELLNQGHRVRIISRRAHFSHPNGPISYAQWSLPSPSPNPYANPYASPDTNPASAHQSLAKHLAHVDAVINLAGAGIADARWSMARKNILITSRVKTTAALAAALQSLPDDSRPHTVLQASAVGYYGNWATMTTAPTCHEYRPVGDDFLAQLCLQWENAIKIHELAKLGTRVAIMRFAPVLERNGGMLARLIPPFTYYMGGSLGSGHQPLPWIHLHDAVAAMLYLLQHPHLHGPFNFTAPQAISMAQFCSALGHALNRPSWFRIPAPLLQVALGELAESTILRGQIAPPERLSQGGFHARFDTIEKAFENL
ncbi:MAG: TIGR01777 family oxidoreductase [Pseudomonadota bacterium]